MKITTKTTKKELAELLALNEPLVQKKDKSLAEQIAYAIQMFGKNEAKVTKKDLNDLVKSATTLLGKKFVTPVLAEEKVEEPKTVKKPRAKKETSENSVKKPLKKKAEPKAEPTETVEEKVEEKKSAPKPTAKKATKKKTEKTHHEEIREAKSKLNEEKAFPEVLEDGDNSYTLAHDITSMEDLFKSVVENEETIIFAFHWNKTQIRVWGYYNNQLPTPKEFPNDLDLCTCLWVSESFVVAYAISTYTEANYCILPEDFFEEDGIRYCQGIDYQIYRLNETK